MPPHAELVAALGSARARRAGYDVAATIDALDALGGADAEARRERDEIIDALKIVRLPHVPALVGSGVDGDRVGAGRDSA